MAWQYCSSASSIVDFKSCKLQILQVSDRQSLFRHKFAMNHISIVQSSSIEVVPCQKCNSICLLIDKASLLAGISKFL